MNCQKGYLNSPDPFGLALAKGNGAVVKGMTIYHRVSALHSPLFWCRIRTGQRSFGGITLSARIPRPIPLFRSSRGMRNFFFGSLMLLALTFDARAQQGDRPDILFISVDDLNDWVGVLGGHPQVLAPNIDALAERGLLFTLANYAASCSTVKSSLR